MNCEDTLHFDEAYVMNSLMGTSMEWSAEC